MSIIRHCNSALQGSSDIIAATVVLPEHCAAAPGGSSGIVGTIGRNDVVIVSAVSLVCKAGRDTLSLGTRNKLKRTTQEAPSMHHAISCRLQS